MFAILKFVQRCLSVPRMSALVLIAGVLVPAYGNAQQPQPSESSQERLHGTTPTQADSLAAVAAWVISDTGRMQPGYRDLSSYDTPGMCLAAIRGVQTALWRQGQVDTLPKYLPADTIPTAARDIGRTCLAKMTPQTVDSADLYDLMSAAMQIGDTALARATAVYHASKITQSVEDRGYVLVDAMQAAFTNHPMQGALVESLFPLVMELGPEAKRPRNMAWSYRKSVATARVDVAAWSRILAEQYAEALREQAEGRIKGVGPGFFFHDSTAIATYQRDPNLPTTVRRLGDQFLAGLLDTGLARTLWEGNIEGDVTIAKIPGTPAPLPFTMFRHYPADAPTGPVPGRVTLVVLADHLGKGPMEPYLGILRRLYEKYHARGLDIMLLTKTQGFAWDSPPLEPEQEAKLIGWYYREHLKLPFTIFVDATRFGRLSDGRLRPQPSQAMPAIGPGRRTWPYIVARDGTIGAVAPTRSEVWLDAYVRRELDIPAPSDRAEGQEVKPQRTATSPSTQSR